MMQKLTSIIGKNCNKNILHRLWTKNVYIKSSFVLQRDEVLEPPCLVHLSDDELKELVDNRGEPPDLCVHSQTCGEIDIR